MSSIEEAFQAFSPQLDEIEGLCNQVLDQFGRGVIQLADGVTLQENYGNGVLFESTKEKVTGIGSRRVTFHTYRDRKPGDVFINVYTHTDRQTLDQAEALAEVFPEIVDQETRTAFGHSHLTSTQMVLVSHFSALIDHPDAKYGYYSGNPFKDGKMLYRKPSPEDLELLGFISESLRSRLQAVLATI